MKFNWDGFKEAMYDKMLSDEVEAETYVGAVRVGDICIDLIYYGEKKLSYDFYVGHEDTGYGFGKKDGMPYDYADGGEITIEPIPFGEFREKAEQTFKEFIEEKDSSLSYSLVEHANRDLEIW